MSLEGLNGRVKRLEAKMMGVAEHYRCELCQDVPVWEHDFPEARERFPRRQPCEACGSPRIKIRRSLPREDGV